MTTEAEKPKRNKRHAKAQKRENNQALLRYPVDITAIVYEATRYRWRASLGVGDKQNDKGHGQNKYVTGWHPVCSSYGQVLCINEVGCPLWIACSHRHRLRTVREQRLQLRFYFDSVNNSNSNNNNNNRIYIAPYGRELRRRQVESVFGESLSE